MPSGFWFPVACGTNAAGVTTTGFVAWNSGLFAARQVTAGVVLVCLWSS